MKNITQIFRRITLGLMLAVIPLVGGCSDNNIIIWTEDVKLLDGRVITVTQKRRIDMKRMPREAWLTFKLPEFGDGEIVWHENLETQVLNVYQGRLYIVGYTYGIQEFHQYGNPPSLHVPYEYRDGQWLRIQISELPEALYDTNMYPDNMAIRRLKHVSVADKLEIFKDDAWMQHQRKVSPNYKSNFSKSEGRQ
jgi:hypothetical protein